MPLIKHGAVVPDPWVAVDDAGELPDGSPVIVTLQRWQAERDQLVRRNSALGIRLKSDQPPSLIAEDLDRFDLVALEFPKFNDGRSYSSARLLRERHGFTGELRAVGNILRDQLMFMHRCGFDAFEVAETAPVDRWLRAFSEIAVWYQPAADGRTPVLALRHRRHGAGPAADAGDSRDIQSATAGAAAEPDSPGDKPGAAVCAANWAY